jgi:hypothetical protein
MAQWAHQYSGLTHDTKVVDREKTLRDTVTRFAQVATDHVPDFAALAARVLWVRRKALRAKLSELREPGSIEQSAVQIQHLEHRLMNLESGGVIAILQEFSVPQTYIDSVDPG